MSKIIEVDENDVRQTMVLLKLLSEARFELKGDALQIAGTASGWLAQLHNRLKCAREQHE